MKKKLRIIPLVVGLLVTSCLAHAQETSAPTAEGLHQRIASMANTISDMDESKPLDALPLYLPGITTNIPTGFGAAPGSLVVGAGFHNDDSKADGAVSVVYGFGEPIKGIGANATLSFFDMDQLGDRGAASIHLFHRASDRVSVAVGYENGATWGQCDSQHSAYIVASQVIKLKNTPDSSFNRTYVTLGLGNGRFQTDEDYTNHANHVNVFAGIATNIDPRTHAFVEWTGKALDLGVSFSAGRDSRLFVTPSITDVTDRTERGTGVALGISYLFTGF